MVKIVGVRFRNAGKVYYFDPKNNKIETGDHVIVETVRGVEYGTAVGGVHEVDEKLVVQPLRSVIRVATADDDARAKRNREKEREALKICQEKISKHGLDMKLIDAEYAFDNNKVLFYFTADGRIDFRELVKDLAAVFKTRIELRQIGVRDETKILGGIGICGRVLCCNSYLSDFAPVSIKMAKEQNLSLNPTKISGACGRLMCCLKNEEDTYEYLNSRLPGIGDSVTTPDGQKGEVHSVNVLRQRVKVLIDVEDEKEIQEFDVADLKFKPRKRKEKGKNKEKDNKDRDNKDRDNKDRDNKDRDGKDRDNKDSDNKDRDNKNGDNRDRDNKGRGNKDGDNKDRDKARNKGGRKAARKESVSDEEQRELEELEQLEELETRDQIEGKQKLNDE